MPLSARVVVRDILDGERALVAWSDSADRALGRMNSLGRDRLAVTDGRDGVIGVCERDVLAEHERRGGWLGSISVADLVRRGPFWCRADDGLDKALKAMGRLRTDVLAVLDREGRVLGTVHRGLLAAAAEAPAITAAGAAPHGKRTLTV